MRTATLIVAAVSSLSLAAPVQAQQGAGAARGASFPRPSVPAARITPSTAPRPGGWHAPRPPQGGWKPGAPGGWKPGSPGRPGGWKPGNPGRPGGWQPGRPGGWQPGRPGNWHPGAQRPGWRWGEKVRGRWQGGWNAPGGWGGYRRPVRGWALPSYWIGGGFWINDWSNWGLSNPPRGYNWVRYYDDAVLVDPYGRVWDSVSGVDWDRGDGYHDQDDYDRDDEDRDAQIDDEDDYGADYDAPDYADAPPPAVHVAPPGMRCVANCYNGGGYGYYGAPATTTVVIQSAPAVTTTTVTEEVIYGGGRKTVRHLPSKRLYRAPAKLRSKTCDCR